MKKRLPATRSYDPSETLTLDDLLAEASSAIAESVPKNTLRAYEADWKDFRAWCTRRHLVPLPATAETISAYLWAKSKVLKTGSVGRRLTTIGFVHKVRGYPDPRLKEEIRKVWQAIRRKKGSAQKGKKPLLTDSIKKIVGALPDDLRGLRDRAIILIGFAGALRRSEIAALEFSDLELTDDGLLISIRRSKTDQDGRGETISIPFGKHQATCPIKALFAWLKEAEIEDGPLFRKINKSGRVEPRPMNGSSIAVLLKLSMKAAGMRTERYGAHSLRAGLATQAAAAGVEERHLQAHTRHKSLAILRRYIREGTTFKNSPAGKVGL